MLIYFKTLFINQKCKSVEVESSDTVRQVKQQYEKQTGIPVEQVKFIFGGTVLSDYFTLADYNIQTDSIINVYLALRGD